MSNLTGRLEKEMAFYEKMEKKLESMPTIMTDYYTAMRANRKSYTSINVYATNVMHFATFLYGDIVPQDFYKNVQISDVERYFISLETRKTASGIKRTGDDVLQQRWSTLNNFFSFLVKRKMLDMNPIAAVDRPKNQTEHKVTYLTKIEINKLMRVIDKNSDDPMAVRDGAIIRLAIATGLRVEALMNINIEDIDFNNGTLSVIEKRKKVRDIDLGERILGVLRDWIEVRNDIFADIDTSALFVSQKKQRLSTDSANDMLKKWVAAAGIDKKITMHKLRATAACALAKNDIPLKSIMKQLGHTNGAVTQRYLDAFEEDQKKATNVLDNMF